MFCVVYSPFLLKRFESTSLFLQNKSKLERFDIICHGGLDQKKIILSTKAIVLSRHILHTTQCDMHFSTENRDSRVVLKFEDLVKNYPAMSIIQNVCYDSPVIFSRKLTQPSHVPSPRCLFFLSTNNMSNVRTECFVGFS
jgi:hypothetical protein